LGNQNNEKIKVNSYLGKGNHSALGKIASSFRRTRYGSQDAATVDPIVTLSIRYSGTLTVTT
ncbi:hypothetical protein HAX54_037942, partial [Datura stramonium]|nr:hypothetical protein [Datura stramonium]